MRSSVQTPPHTATQATRKSEIIRYPVVFRKKEKPKALSLTAMSAEALDQDQDLAQFLDLDLD
jgi:hypothetical protein